MIEAGKIERRLPAGRADAARAAFSRRGFLLGAAGITLGAVAAGCGGGGGGNNRNANSGAYRFVDENGAVGASVTVDQNGRVTFWTLDTDQQITDFGQTRVNSSSRFTLESEADDIRTTGEITGSQVFGRTERLSDTRRGFDWGGDRVDSLFGNDVAADFAGTYRVATQISDVDVFLLLGIAPDGNATLFAAFDDLTDNADPFPYRFEGLSFNGSGEVDDRNYFLNLSGDRVALRDDARGLRLLYEFANDPGLGRLSGETFNIPLSASRAVGEPGALIAHARTLSGANAERLRAAFKSHALAARSRQRGRARR